MKIRSTIIIVGITSAFTGCAGHSAVSTGDIDPVESAETAAPREFGIEDVNAAAVNARPRLRS